mmetsp:Transcript_49366/g.155264  ORF Transcript_49366/g.155264 Transcript_49366/m.155264 type:complete len:303 (+) Transcript_49366:402-1310(+)
MLHAREKLVGKRDFLRTVHLGLHDVDGALARVAPVLQVEFGDHASEDGIQNAFWDIVAVLVHNGPNGHQVPNVADEEQGAAGQHERGAVRCKVEAILVHLADLALAERRRELALHEAQPVAIDADLVCSIHCSHGVFAVHDGAHGGLQPHVGHARRVVPADHVGPGNLHFHVEAMIPEEDLVGLVPVPDVAGKLAWVLQAALRDAHGHHQRPILNGVPRGSLVAAFFQREDVVEKLAAPGHDFVAADLVVGGCPLRTTCLRDGVGAVERAVEATPASICGVDCEARIRHRHHQLGARDGGNL